MIWKLLLMLFWQPSMASRSSPWDGVRDWSHMSDSREPRREPRPILMTAVDLRLLTDGQVMDLERALVDEPQYSRSLSRAVIARERRDGNAQLHIDLYNCGQRTLRRLGAITKGTPIEECIRKATAYGARE